MSAPQRVAAFYGELKRRRVVRVAVAYSVTAAAIIQLTDPVSAALSLPPATLTVVVIAAVAGLPVVLVLSWLFDIKRDTPDESGPIAHVSSPAPSPVYRIGVPVSPLIGRERELDEAMSLLSEPHCRLLTLTGPGGMGKTRLAIEIANRTAAAFSHGACLIPLAGVEDADGLPAALAEALGFILSTRENPARQLSGFLEEKQLLIVLDNFEQIVDGGPLVAELMATARHVRFLVTSRRRLRVEGETILDLEALAVPQADALDEQTDAARLFVQIARRSDPRFAPTADDVVAIGRICRIVDGIPLAIELTAASVGVLSCAEIAREIEQSHLLLLGARRDLPPRHQSLHAAFESSWRLLDDDERRALRRLSVFRNGFDRDTAAAIAGADLRLIVRLVEVSLVHRPALSRFQMLEVLRQFAEEKLAETGTESAEMQQRHAQHFLTRARTIRTHMGRDRNDAVDVLAEWLGDVLAAWNHAVDVGDWQELHGAAIGVHLLLEARGRGVEGADLFHSAAAMVRGVAMTPGPESVHATTTLARLLTREAAFLSDSGRIPEAAALLEEAVPLVRAHDDTSEIAFAVARQCNIAIATGNFGASAFEECLALYREIGDTRGVAWALNAFGGAQHARGAYAEAKRLYRESAALFRSIGLDEETWPAINNLAGIAQLENDYTAAREILEAELETFRTRKNPRALSFLLNNLGYVVYLSGDHERARQILAESITLARAMGYRSRLAYSLNTLASLESDDGRLDAAAHTFHDALGVATSAGEATLSASILVGIARLYMRRHEPTRAERILLAVENHAGCDQETRSGARALRETIAEHTGPVDNAGFDDVLRAELNASVRAMA